MLDLYKNIKKRRLELKLTQSQLADRMNYADKSMIAKIEKGQVDLTQSKIITFAEKLGVSTAYLMGWEDENGNPIGLEKMETTILDLDIDVVKFEKFSYYNSGMLDIYKNNYSQFTKWHTQSVTKLEQSIANVKSGILSTTTLYVPFDESTTSNGVDSLSDFIRSIERTINSLNDLEKRLDDLEYELNNGSPPPTIDTVDEMKQYLRFKMFNFKTETLSDDRIKHEFENVLKKEKEETENFKQVLGIKDDNQIYL